MKCELLEVRGGRNGYKCPEGVEVRTELSTTPVGKMLRRERRNRAKQVLGSLGP